MIRKIQIRNFQIHRNLTINCDPRVTTIIGSSDTGKSAIIRAIRWITFNQPLGDSFIRTGSKQAAVIIETDEHVAKRKKRSNLNLYQLDNQKYTAFKHDVPSPVSEALNLSKLNFQNQHDRPYWLDETAGEVSRQLNQIVNLAIIDSTMSNIASRLREARSEESVIKKRLNEAAKKRRELKYIRKQDVELQYVEFIQGEWKKMDDRAKSLMSACEEVRIYRDNSEKLRKMARHGEAVRKIGARWAGMDSRLTDLRDAVLLVNINKKAAEREIPDISPLDEIKTRLEEIVWNRKAFTNLIETIKEFKDNLDNKVAARDKAEEEFKEAIGETCPLCGSPGKCPKCGRDILNADN